MSLNPCSRFCVPMHTAYCILYVLSVKHFENNQKTECGEELFINKLLTNKKRKSTRKIEEVKNGKGFCNKIHLNHNYDDNNKIIQ